MSDLEMLKEQILALSVADRERLVDDILASFSSTGRDAIGNAWIEEIERRRNAYLDGRIPTVTLKDSRKRLGL
jgi:putative addiction module component (TIGR02574 family)